MAPLAPLFASGELAIVHACGSHDPTRSHFDAQDYMESGTPGVKSTRDGWLNRYLHAKDHERETPFRSLRRVPRGEQEPSHERSRQHSKKLHPKSSSPAREAVRYRVIPLSCG